MRKTKLQKLFAKTLTAVTRESYAKALNDFKDYVCQKAREGKLYEERYDGDLVRVDV